MRLLIFHEDQLVEDLKNVKRSSRLIVMLQSVMSEVKIMRIEGSPLLYQYHHFFHCLDC